MSIVESPERILIEHNNILSIVKLWSNRIAIKDLLIERLDIYYAYKLIYLGNNKLFVMYGTNNFIYDLKLEEKEVLNGVFNNYKYNIVLDSNLIYLIDKNTKELIIRDIKKESRKRKIRLSINKIPDRIIKYKDYLMIFIIIDSKLKVLRLNIVDENILSVEYDIFDFLPDVKIYNNLLILQDHSMMALIDPETMVILDSFKSSRLFIFKNKILDMPSEKINNIIMYDFYIEKNKIIKREISKFIDYTISRMYFLSENRLLYLADNEILLLNIHNSSILSRITILFFIELHIISHDKFIGKSTDGEEGIYFYIDNDNITQLDTFHSEEMFKLENLKEDNYLLTERQIPYIPKNIRDIISIFI